ncbi:MAG: right-handed parallel beta-helix repeat-containing protein [Planctomycetota bacterium]
MVLTDDGGFVFNGSISSDLTDRDIYLAKVNRFGNIMAYMDISLIGNDWVDRIIQLSNGNFVTAVSREDVGELALVKVKIIESNEPQFNEIDEQIKFNYPIDSFESLSGEIQIYNMGAGTLNWQIEENSPWLTVSPDSGSSVGETTIVNLVLDPNGLAVGLYETQLTITDPCSGNSPVALTVFLNVYDSNFLLVPGSFFTIQEAVDHANDNSTIILEPGVYTGDGNVEVRVNKPVTIRSTKPNNSTIVRNTIIDCEHNGGFGINSSDPNAVVQGLTIQNSQSYGLSIPIVNNCLLYNNLTGINLHDLSNFKIKNCLIANSQYHAITGGKGIPGSPLIIDIENCTIVDTQPDQWGRNSVIDIKTGEIVMKITNSIFSNESKEYEIFFLPTHSSGNNNLRIANCCLSSGPNSVYIYDLGVTDFTYDPGNIHCDPCFVTIGYWDANGTPGDANDDFWVNGDYHLKSEGWRWDSVRNWWDYDDVTSRCIDAGNPGCPLGDEPMSVPDDPNNTWGENIRINMGAYGGTAEASIPPYDWTLLADLTNDGIVNFEDYAGQVIDWSNSGDCQPGDLNRDGVINMPDLVLLIEDWLKETAWH